MTRSTGAGRSLATSPTAADLAAATPLTQLLHDPRSRRQRRADDGLTGWSRFWTRRPRPQARRHAVAATRTVEATEPRVMLAAATLPLDGIAIARTPFADADPTIREFLIPRTPVSGGNINGAVWVGDIPTFQANYFTPLEFNAESLKNDDLTSAELTVDFYRLVERGGSYSRGNDVPEGLTGVNVGVFAYTSDGLLNASDYGRITSATALVGSMQVTQPGIETISLDVEAINDLRTRHTDGIGLVLRSLDPTPSGAYVTIGYDSYAGFGPEDPVGATLAVETTPSNEAPVVSPTSISAVQQEGTEQRYFPDVFDPDGDTLDIRVVSQPQNGEISVRGDLTFAYEPYENFTGTDSFIIGFFDDEAETQLPVSVLVTNINDAPIFDDATFDVDEDTPLSAQLVASDVDEGDELAFSLISGPSNGSLSLNDDGSFTYQGDANFFGTDSFEVLVDDQSTSTPGPLTDTATITVNVAPVNDRPTTGTVALTPRTDEDRSNIVSLTIEDVDTATEDLSVVIVEPPEFVTITGTRVTDSGGRQVAIINYSPPANFNGTDSLVVAVSDGQGQTRDVPITITVNPVNDAPVADDLAVSGDEDATLAGQVTASDVDDADLTFTLLDAPSDGEVTVNFDGSFSYLGDANFNGDDSFTVLVSDGELTDTATVSVSVAAVNDAPTLDDLTLTIDEDSSVAGQLVGSDVEGDDLSFTLLSGASNGEVTVETDGVFFYRGDRDFDGVDQFTVQVSDGDLTGTAVVTIELDSINDAPIAEDGFVAGDEDASIRGQLEAVDVDTDAADLTFTLNEAPANGSVTVNADGSFTYVGDANFNGTDFFTFTVSDGEFSDTAEMVVGVAAVNDAPVLDDAAFSVDENSPAGTAVGTIAASDVEGNEIEYMIVAGNEAGQFTIDPFTGAITVAAGASLDFESTAAYQLTVRATEAETVEGLSDEALIDIAIGDVDEQPQTLDVGIDIDPGDRRNRVSLLRNRFLRVAITGSDTFDVTDIDLSSVQFGVDGDETGALTNRRGRFYGYYADVNGDGTRDLVLFFDLYRTGIFDNGLQFGQFDMTLSGQLNNGQAFAGSDTLNLTLLRT